MLREPFNALSHALGVGLALLGTLFLLRLAETPPERAGAWVFGLSMALMYGTSALYHALHLGLGLLRRLDHAAIFLFIAGTYTPLLLTALPEAYRGPTLLLIWTLALLGVGFRVFFLKAPRWLYTLSYLGLGWLAVFLLPFLRLDRVALLLLLLGGAAYSLGALVYARRRPDPWPQKIGFHGLWHLFVLLGSFFMYLGVARAYALS